MSGAYGGPDAEVLVDDHRAQRAERRGRCARTSAAARSGCGVARQAHRHRRDAAGRPRQAHAELRPRSAHRRRRRSSARRRTASPATQRAVALRARRRARGRMRAVLADDRRPRSRPSGRGAAPRRRRRGRAPACRRPSWARSAPPARPARRLRRRRSRRPRRAATPRQRPQTTLVQPLHRPRGVSSTFSLFRFQPGRRALSSDTSPGRDPWSSHGCGHARGRSRPRRSGRKRRPPPCASRRASPPSSRSC